MPKDIDPSGGFQNPHPLTRQEKKKYEEEYRHAADLFQRALENHAQSTDMYQKAEFQDVMEDMMKVLNETAAALKAKELKNQNHKIAQDYATYQQGSSSQTEKTLVQDLEKAKKSV